MLILIDTSVWVDHLRNSDERLIALLQDAAVLAHPFIIGELALGSLRDRTSVIGLLSDLPHATEASHDEVLLLIERHSLFARGLGYVDVHLLACVLLTEGAKLWTRDKRLETAADELAVSIRWEEN